MRTRRWLTLVFVLFLAGCARDAPPVVPVAAMMGGWGPCEPVRELQTRMEVSGIMPEFGGAKGQQGLSTAYNGEFWASLEQPIDIAVWPWNPADQVSVSALGGSVSIDPVTWRQWDGLGNVISTQGDESEEITDALDLWHDGWTGMGPAAPDTGATAGTRGAAPGSRVEPAQDSRQAARHGSNCSAGPRRCKKSYTCNRAYAHGDRVRRQAVPGNAATHRRSFGSAVELAFHAKKGEILQFHCRPRNEVTDHDCAGACSGDAGRSWA